MKKSLLYPLLLIAAMLFACHSSIDVDSWPEYGGSKGRTHYVALRQIDTGNVGGLRQAWVYHCGDADSNSQIQVNPIIIGHTLYGISPRLKLFALDAASGQPKWSFDPAKLVPV